MYVRVPACVERYLCREVCVSVRGAIARACERGVALLCWRVVEITRCGADAIVPCWAMLVVAVLAYGFAEGRTPCIRALFAL